MNSFDAKINTENLTKCLQTLKQFYADLYKDKVQLFWFTFLWIVSVWSKYGVLKPNGVAIAGWKLKTLPPEVLQLSRSYLLYEISLKVNSRCVTTCHAGYNWLATRLRGIISGTEMNSRYYCIPNQRIVFFACSDWPLKFEIVCAVNLPAFSRFCRRVFPCF